MQSPKLAAVEPAEHSLRSDAQKSRAALLAAASELMAETGPEALTVVAVAQRAGLNRSTAYQHFRSREQLLGAVGDVFAGELRRMFSQPRDFGAQVDFFVGYFLDHPDIARTWLFRLLSNGRETEPGAWATYVKALERLARSPRSQDGIDPEMLGIIGMSAALVWSLMARQRSNDEETAQAETRRFAHELKRLFRCGALRPESWPELAGELAHEKGPR